MYKYVYVTVLSLIVASIYEHLNALRFFFSLLKIILDQIKKVLPIGHLSHMVFINL